MATQSRTTHIYRPECIRHILTFTYADTTVNHKLTMAPGVYELTMLVRTTATFDAAVKVGLLKPFLDLEQTVVADTPFALADADDVASVTEVTVATTAARAMQVVGTFGAGLANIHHGPFPIPFGLQFTFTKATSPTAGALTVEILAARMV